MLTQTYSKLSFDANPKVYITMTEIIEILVQSDSLAQQLKQRIAAGEEVEPLAAAPHGTERLITTDT